jgi:hypothetical protein
MRGHVRHGGGGTEPQALRTSLDAVVEKPREADQPRGPAHIFLQKLHHVGAAGDVFGGLSFPKIISARSDDAIRIRLAQLR